jgi:hypothetical protein
MRLKPPPANALLTKKYGCVERMFDLVALFNGGAAGWSRRSGHRSCAMIVTLTCKSGLRPHPHHTWLSPTATWCGSQRAP